MVFSYAALAFACFDFLEEDVLLVKVKEVVKLVALTYVL
jgi:hypothetical protein